jgi:hypothetical protein
LDWSLQLLENIQDGADDLRNIWRSIDIAAELLRHDVNICLREDGYEQLIIAALVVAIKCERLSILTLANFRKTVGIALLANDAEGNWGLIRFLAIFQETTLPWICLVPRSLSNTQPEQQLKFC